MSELCIEITIYARLSRRHWKTFRRLCNRSRVSWPYPVRQPGERTGQGEGLNRTQLQYMPDVESACPECKGQRFTDDTLEIRCNGQNIADVLALTVRRGADFFKPVRLIHHKLKRLQGNLYM